MGYFGRPGGDFSRPTYCMNITRANFTAPAQVTGLTTGAGQIVAGASTGGLTTSTPGANGTVVVYDNTQVSGLNATAAPSFSSLTVSGLISANGGVTVATGQTLTLNGNAALTIGSGTLGSGGPITTTGAISTTGSGTVTAAGLLTASAGATVATGQTLTLSGNAALTIGTGTLSSGGPITTTGAISTTGSGTVTAAGLLTASAGATVAAGQILTLASTATMSTNSGAITLGSGGITGTGNITTTGALTAVTIAAGFKFGAPNSSTTYTGLSLTDANTLVLSTNAATQTITIPANATVAYPVGTQISFSQEGAGKVTLAPAVGVTFTSFNTYLSTAGQYAIISAIQTTADAWRIVGNLAT